jgi:hypothetical protein
MGILRSSWKKFKGLIAVIIFALFISVIWFIFSDDIRNLWISEENEPVVEFTCDKVDGGVSRKELALLMYESIFWKYYDINDWKDNPVDTYSYGNLIIHEGERKRQAIGFYTGSTVDSLIAMRFYSEETDSKNNEMAEFTEEFLYSNVVPFWPTAEAAKTLNENQVFSSPEELRNAEIVEPSNIYGAANSNSVCFLLKYSDILNEEFIDLVEKICVDQYKEEILADPDLNPHVVCAGKYMDELEMENFLSYYLNRDSLKITSMAEEYNLSSSLDAGDKAIDFYLLYKRGLIDNPACLKNALNKHIAETLLNMHIDAMEMESDSVFSSDIYPLLSTLYYIAEDIDGEDLYERMFDQLLPELETLRIEADGSYAWKDIAMLEMCLVNNEFHQEDPLFRDYLNVGDEVPCYKARYIDQKIVRGSCVYGKDGGIYLYSAQDEVDYAVYSNMDNNLRLFMDLILLFNKYEKGSD